MTPKPFKRWVLPNGLTFLYRQSPGVPLAAATLLLRVGSRDETPAQAGLASLSAEMMLLGTRSGSARQIAAEIESIGASLGVQTAEDYTELGFGGPVTQLPRMLNVMADVLARPTFPPVELKKERASILAALQSRHDGIFNVAYDALNAQLFGSHPYGRPIDGTSDTVRRFTRADLQAWHRRHIHPDRAVFALVASLPEREARRQVEKALKIWPSSTRTPPLKKGGMGGFGSEEKSLPASLFQREEIKIKVKARFEQAYYMTGMIAPTINEPDHIPLKILNTLLGGGMSSRLFLRLREELGLAYEVSSFFPTHLMPSQWVIYLGLPPAKLPIAKKALRRLLDTLVRTGPAQSEIDQSVAMIKGSYLMEHQTRRRQAWYAAWWEFLGRGPDYDQKFLNAIERVTPEQVKVLAQRLLSEPRVTVEVTPR